MPTDHAGRRAGGIEQDPIERRLGIEYAEGRQIDRAQPRRRPDALQRPRDERDPLRLDVDGQQVGGRRGSLQDMRRLAARRCTGVEHAGVRVRAQALQQQGLGLIDAILKACRQRLRPILMTSLAFMMGVLPLALASGAGSGSQRAIGVGVLGGMASATVLGIFFVPLFYLWVRKRFSRDAAKPAAPAEVSA